MKKIFLLAAVAFAITACDNSEDISVASRVPLNISASISEMTRAEGTSWADDDSIGITVSVGSLDKSAWHPHKNVKYTKVSGADNSFLGDTLFFYNNMIITAYYPFTDDQSKSAGIIKNSTTPDKQNPTAQREYDFLYARKTGVKVADCNNIQLSFSHMMSKLTFSFVNASSDHNNPMDVSKMAAYSIEGLKLAGSFNTLTGDCGPDADVESDTLYIYTRGKVVEKQPMPSLLVFPQVPEIPYVASKKDGTNTEIDSVIVNKARLHMYIDEAWSGDESHYQHYYCTLSFGENGLKPGYHYNFKIYVTKVGMIMGDMTIVKWDDVNTSLAATIDGDIDLPDE